MRGVGVEEEEEAEGGRVRLYAAYGCTGRARLYSYIYSVHVFDFRHDLACDFILSMARTYSRT